MHQFHPVSVAHISPLSLWPLPPSQSSPCGSINQGLLTSQGGFSQGNTQTTSKNHNIIPPVCVLSCLRRVCQGSTNVSFQRSVLCVQERVQNASCVFFLEMMPKKRLFQNYISTITAVKT